MMQEMNEKLEAVILTDTFDSEFIQPKEAGPCLRE
jgi:hypothetical protein